MRTFVSMIEQMEMLSSPCNYLATGTPWILTSPQVSLAAGKGRKGLARFLL